MIYLLVPAAVLLIICILAIVGVAKRSKKTSVGMSALRKYAKIQLHGSGGKLRGTLTEMFDGKLRVRLEKSKDLNRIARIGESYTVLLPGDDCVVNFTTKVLDVDDDAEFIVISEPEEVDLSNRRRSDRTYKVAGVKTKINGEEATFVNMGTRGAKITSVSPQKVGSYIELYVPASPSFIRAIVLSCEAPSSSAGEYTTRIQFERPVIAKAA